jgi:EpsI family protein
MLSIVYSANEWKQKIHWPEGCYIAQGFNIVSQSSDVIDTPYGSIPVYRMEADSKHGRIEQVTYWVLHGRSFAQRGLLDRETLFKLERAGNIPDGLLFRISTIGSNLSEESKVQDQFVRSLAASMAQDNRGRYFGLPE